MAPKEFGAQWRKSHLNSQKEKIPQEILHCSLAKSNEISSVRGLHCEAVALEHYRKLGYKILQQRFRSPYAEIDLIVESPHGDRIIVEVKSLSHSDWIQVRIPAGQRKRLVRAFEYLCELWCMPLIFHLVIVTQLDQVFVVEDVL